MNMKCFAMCFFVAAGMSSVSSARDFMQEPGYDFFFQALNNACTQANAKLYQDARFNIADGSTVDAKLTCFPDEQLKNQIFQGKAIDIGKNGATWALNGQGQGPGKPPTRKDAFSALLLLSLNPICEKLSGKFVTDFDSTPPKFGCILDQSLVVVDFKMEGDTFTLFAFEQKR